MGSGIILLVIVGAWLAVLVPMALRSHQSSTAMRSADRFGDAMRVLSRRGVVQGRDILVPRRSDAGPALSRPAAPPVPAVVLTPAQRRARLLLTLVVLAVATLVGGLVGPRSVLLLHGLTDLLLVAFVVHLRTQAVQRQARRRRLARVEARTQAHGEPPRVAGVPDRMPARPTPLRAPLPAPAARHDEPVPAAATSTSSWSPVPVPLPSYVGKAVAPPRPTRVLDLTRPGTWSADPDLEGLGDERELEDLIEARRAVNGW